MDFRQLIQSQFDPEVALHLTEFGNSIARLNADVVMFMARKSLCLFDVLLRLGITPPQQVVVSDRILDMRLDILRGKRVALIDDTLILGTTLAKTKRLLYAAGAASVTCHVFCVDTKWWCKDLIVPDTIELEMGDEAVMSFCSATVRALSLSPRPYIVDFPVSKPVKIPANNSHLFLSDIAWTGHNISTPLQERHDIAALTFFPSDTELSDLRCMWGPSVMDCLDLVKVRGFARKQRDVFWVQLVPIVVLKPLRVKAMDLLFRHLVSRYEEASQRSLKLLSDLCASPESKQRFVQYALSTSLGRRFHLAIDAVLPKATEFGYDAAEAARHFGPWVLDDLEAIHAVELRPFEGELENVAPVDIPEDISVWSADILKHNGDNLLSRNAAESAENLLGEVAEVFLNNYDLREIPTRLEVQRLGARFLDNGYAGPVRDRLEMGLPWPLVTKYIADRLDREPNNQLSNVLSLVLDFCNDQGISVPITCVFDDVVFRAYRHGEDVKFTDAEVGLSYHAIDGFLDSSRSRTITSLKLEKLLVLLIKAGIARGFMEPLFTSTPGVEPVLRIGFDLRGAVPMVRRGHRGKGAKDEWFSNYLLRRGVIAREDKKRYSLRRQIEGNYRIASAPDEAWELGNLIGSLCRGRTNPTAPLDDNSLTLLATCATPRHAAAALQAELDLISEWWCGRSGETQLALINWDDPWSVNALLKRLLSSNGHMAVNSGVLKYAGYSDNAVKKIVDECGEYLGREFSKRDVKRWKAYWSSLSQLEAIGEKEVCDPLIDKAIVLLWEVAVCIYLMELSLRYHLKNTLGAETSYGEFTRTMDKIDGFRTSMRKRSIPPTAFVQAITKRLDEIRGQLDRGFDSKAAFSYALSSLATRMPEVESRVEIMTPIIERYGKLFSRRDYSYLAYYDLMDSTATKAGRQDIDVEQYRLEIDGCKRFINSQLSGVASRASKEQTEVFLWNGTGSSTNDCKHILIGGPSSMKLLHETVACLQHALEAYPMCSMRIHLVPCAFANTTVYRQEFGTEADGKRFWEHWSRVAKQLSSFEATLHLGQSFLAIASERLIRDFVLPDGMTWVESLEAEITSEIEMLSRTVKVKYGPVHT